MIYFVPTPIGNLGDITLRAIDVLKSCEIILCEDTRTSKKLLDYYQIEAKLISYHKFNETQRIDEIIKLSQEGNDIAVISDAGMPGISDPGSILINSLIENSIEYTVLPGASASITALVMSGFETSKFTFLGFIPSKGSEKKSFIDSLKDTKETQIFYEAPHRIIKTLESMAEAFPNRTVCVIREISKVFEDIKIFKASNFDKAGIVEKGEIVVLVDKYSETVEITDELIKSKLTELIEDGITKKTAVKEVSKLLNISKNKVYELSLDL